MIRLGSLIRLLNRGGESSALRADQQFKIVVADERRVSSRTFALKRAIACSAMRRRSSVP
jgi:hypothetical protein